MARPLTHAWAFLCLVLAASAAGAAGQTFSISALRSQLATAAPGTVFTIPAGVHLVDAPLLLPTGVSLRGAGMAATTLLLDRTNAANFKYGFVLAPKPDATGVTVTDLTIDGGRTPTGTSTTTLAANIGGGISVGSGWTVERLRLGNLNYFKVWARAVSNVVLRSLVFEDPAGTESGGNDNIGGGRVDGMLMDNCTVTPSARGNGLDLLRSRNLTLTRSRFLGSPTAPHNVYLEAVTDSLVSGNRFEYSNLALQSDNGYSDTVVPVNPKNTMVSGNTVVAPIVQGISIRYDDGIVGGGNTLTGNTVVSAGASGIITFAAAAGLVAEPDTVTANVVVDPFRRGTDKEWNCGYGVTGSTGITLGVGPVIAGGNTITSTTTAGATTALKSGTQLGLRSTRKISVTVAWNGGDDAVTGATYVRWWQPI